jgi:crotonobetainyl-CoA:carnitine CoA-transferase CaiB-like acyl-CoA transferase
VAERRRINRGGRGPRPGRLPRRVRLPIPVGRTPLGVRAVDSTPLLDGLHVVDLGSFVAGPAAATILADFGADVIKVEPPGVGDTYRMFSRTPPSPVVNGVDYTWQLDNRNKRSIELNLKSPRAAAVLERLVRWADVLVTNFPPPTRARLRLDYEDLAGLNPRLIYADVTGFGESGPDAGKPGFDATAYWARSGLMDLTRQGSAPPSINVPGMGDHSTAVTLFAGIMTALYRRERTGTGARGERVADRRRRMGDRVLVASRARRRQEHPADRPLAPVERPRERLPHGRRTLVAARLREREQ